MKPERWPLLLLALLTAALGYDLVSSYLRTRSVRPFTALLFAGLLACTLVNAYRGRR